MSLESSDLPIVITILYKGFHPSKFHKIALSNQDELCASIDKFISHYPYLKDIDNILNIQEQIRCKHTLRSSGLKLMIAKTNHDESIIIFYYSSENGNYIVSFNKETCNVIGYIKTFSDELFDRIVLEIGDRMDPDTE